MGEHVSEWIEIRLSSFTRRSLGRTWNMRAHMVAHIQNCDQREHFFFTRVIPYWNKLPLEVVNSNSTNAFKNNLDKYNGLPCWSSSLLLLTGDY